MHSHPFHFLFLGYSLDKEGYRFTKSGILFVLTRIFASLGSELMYSSGFVKAFLEYFE